MIAIQEKLEAKALAFTSTAYELVFDALSLGGLLHGSRYLR